MLRSLATEVTSPRLHSQWDCVQPPSRHSPEFRGATELQERSILSQMLCLLVDDKRDTKKAAEHKVSSPHLWVFLFSCKSFGTKGAKNKLSPCTMTEKAVAWPENRGRWLIWTWAIISSKLSQCSGDSFLGGKEISRLISLPEHHIQHSRQRDSHHRIATSAQGIQMRPTGTKGNLDPSCCQVNNPTSFQDRAWGAIN